MKTVAEILNSKPEQTIHTTTPTASVFDAVTSMAKKNVGALLVLKEGKVVGIITERDYARKIAVMSRSSRETPVSDIMTREVMCVRPDHTSDQCMALMTENRFRHLLVMDGDKLLGIISIGDLVKGVIADQQFIIEQLEHYIAGDRG